MTSEREQSESPEKPAGSTYGSCAADLVPGGYTAIEVNDAATSGKERRKHRRIASRNGKAAILCSGKQQIVEMLNVSRGGLYIRTNARYAVGIFVQVAVHYVEGANNIFQPARIARVNLAPTSTLPGEYGIEIMRSGIKP